MKRALSYKLCLDVFKIGPWVASKTDGIWSPNRSAGIAKEKNGEIIAGILYENWNKASVTVHFAGDGNWADRYFLAVIFDYPFNQLGVKMMIAPVCSTNQKCIDMVKHMGFNKEAELPGATSKGNLLFFVMNKEDCKYLRGKYSETIQPPAST